MGLPQMMRSAPMTAGAPIFLAPPRLHQMGGHQLPMQMQPQYTSMASSMASTMNGAGGPPPLVSAANSFVYQFDPFCNMQPMFEYTQAYENSTAGKFSTIINEIYPIKKSILC